jgi:hypothetical protein
VERAQPRAAALDGRQSAGATTTPDGVVREAASGHADYPRPVSVNGTDVLQTTGYNTAVVIAGLSELAVPK